jgi:hypothetical protein
VIVKNDSKLDLKSKIIPMERLIRILNSTLIISEMNEFKYINYNYSGFASKTESTVNSLQIY